MQVPISPSKGRSKLCDKPENFGLRRTNLLSPSAVWLQLTIEARDADKWEALDIEVTKKRVRVTLELANAGFDERLQLRNRCSVRHNRYVNDDRLYLDFNFSPVSFK